MKKIIFVAILSVASTCFAQTPQVQSTRYLQSGTVTTTLSGSNSDLYIRSGTGGTLRQVISGSTPLVDSQKNNTNIVTDGDSITDSLNNESNSISCTTVSGTNLVTVGGGGTAIKVFPGQALTGTGIPANTKVRTVRDSTHVTITNNATANGTATLAFTGTTWPLQLANLSAVTGKTNVQVINAAVAGTTIVDAIARYTASVHPYCPAVSGCARAVYIPLVGGNDMTADPYATIASFETLCNLAKADGFEVWACTIPWKAAAASIGTTLWTFDPQSTSYSNASITNWQLLNRLIRESTVPDHVIDLASQQIDTQFDWTHPTVLGSKQIAQFVNMNLLTGGAWPSSDTTLNGIFNTLTPAPLQGITLNRTDSGTSTAANSYGMGINYTFNNTQDSTGSVQNPMGLFVNTLISGTQMQNTTISGLNVFAKMSSGLSGTASQVDGITLQMDSTLGKINSAYALHIKKPSLTGTSAGGILGSSVAILVDDQAVGQGTGSVGTGKYYALYMSGTNDYAYLGPNLELSRPLGVGNGGTGLATLTGIPYGSGTGAMAAVTIGSGLSLTSGTLTATAAGFPTPYTIGDLLVASGTGTLTTITASATNKVLTATGTGAAPVWAAVPFAATSGVANSGTNTNILAIQQFVTNSGTTAATSTLSTSDGATATAINFSGGSSGTGFAFWTKGNNTMNLSGAGVLTCGGFSTGSGVDSTHVAFGTSSIHGFYRPNSADMRWAQNGSDVVAITNSSFGVNLTGTNITAACTLPSSSTSRASLRLVSGTAPTAPNAGDMWYDGTNFVLQTGTASTSSVTLSGTGSYAKSIAVLSGTMSGGTVSFSDARIGAHNCWFVDRESSFTNVGQHSLTISGTTATVSSVNVLDVSPIDLFIAP